jgi:hypothetical protein
MRREAPLDLSLTHFRTHMFLICLLLLVFPKSKARTVAKLSGLVTALNRKLNTMMRIVDRVVYESKPADFVRLKAIDLGNGHLEVSAHRPQVWHEWDYQPADLDAWIAEGGEPTKLEQQERALRLLQRAAQRAKGRVRQLCKVMGADTLLTLTYKQNVTDESLCKADLKEFVRRVRRVLPDFKAVVGFEQQKRGAWHVHLATLALPPALQNKAGIKVKSFDLVRSIWRGVTKERGGNIDVSRRKRNSKRSPARLAAYLSKYITKAFEDGAKWSNRWTKFGDFDTPRAVQLGEFPTLLDAMRAAYSLALDVQVTASSFVSKWGDSFFVAFESQPRRIEHA